MPLKRDFGATAASGILGVRSAALYALVAFAFAMLLDLRLLYASSAAFILTVWWSYCGHARWTFGQERVPAEKSARFALSGLAVYGAVTLAALVGEALRWPDPASIAFSAVAGAMASFLVNRLLTIAPAREPLSRKARTNAAN